MRGGVEKGWTTISEGDSTSRSEARVICVSTSTEKGVACANDDKGQTSSLTAKFTRTRTHGNAELNFSRIQIRGYN